MSTVLLNIVSSVTKKLKLWWSSTSQLKLIAAESELLADASLLSCRVQLVGKDGSRLRTLDLPGPVGTENLPPIILLHGFGMGLAFWGRQLAEFRKYRRVIAIDLPGMGGSDPLGTVLATLSEVEDYFILALESWREKMEVRRMVLVGAGFGAYVSAIYSLRYHKRVDHLIMLSPAGMERRSKDQVHASPKTPDASFVSSIGDSSSISFHNLFFCTLLPCRRPTSLRFKACFGTRASPPR
jgi:pimeloyl-ACP methyl ester carboxylesterase